MVVLSSTHVVNPRRRLPACRVSDRGATVDADGVSRQDHDDVVDRLTAIGDITGAVSAMPFELAGHDVFPVELPEVLSAVAAAATRRLGDRIVTYLPPAVVDAEPPPGAVSPDVCVPVVAADVPEDPGLAGHLHLSCVAGAQPTASDRVTLEVLAGHAVDLSAARHRERRQAEAADLLRRELAAAREEAAQLTGALASNRQIGIATGIVAASQKVTTEQAFRRLTEISQNSNRKLRDVADDVVYTGATPPPVPLADRTARQYRQGRKAAVAGASSRGSDKDSDAPAHQRYRIDLTLGRDRVELRLAGEFDLAAQAALARVVTQLDPLTVSVHCIARDVTFADSHGLDPIIAAARRRNRAGRPPFVVDQASHAMAQAIRLCEGADLLSAPTTG